LYAFAIRPDLAFYFKVPVDVSLGRILSGRAKVKYYEAGMDLNLSQDPIESFSRFQSKILEEYDRVVEEHKLTVIDATGEIDEQQEIVRDVVTRTLSRDQSRRSDGQAQILRGGDSISGSPVPQSQG
jgi:dTMP kinase